VIEQSSGASETAAQRTLLDRSELQQCRRASGIRDSRTAFEPTHIQHINGKINNGGRAVDERASPPERLVQREAHFRGTKTGFNWPELEQTGSGFTTVRHDRKADVPASAALALDPADES
jgi:hypothetical protein